MYAVRFFISWFVRSCDAEQFFWCWDFVNVVLNTLIFGCVSAGNIQVPAHTAVQTNKESMKKARIIESCLIFYVYIPIPCRVEQTQSSQHTFPTIKVSPKIWSTTNMVRESCWMNLRFCQWVLCIWHFGDVEVFLLIKITVMMISLINCRWTRRWRILSHSHEMNNDVLHIHTPHTYHGQ